MLSASNNSAASTIEKQLILLKHFGADYPVDAEREAEFFKTHDATELGRIFLDTMNGAVIRNGLDPELIRRNIREMVDAFTAEGIVVVLAGMKTVPNLGPAYTRAFQAVYPAIAKEYHLPFIPFLLAGVGGVDSLNQADGIHPTAEGQKRVAENVWKVLRPLL